MPFSDLTITRDNIDSYAKQTFERYNDINVDKFENSILGLDEKDKLMVDEAKKDLKADILDRTSDYLSDDTYADDDALLDAIYTVDDDNDQFLQKLLTFLFLGMWLQQDSSNIQSKSYQDSKDYYRKYGYYLPRYLRIITRKLPKKKQVDRPIFRHTYG